MSQSLLSDLCRMKIKGQFDRLLPKLKLFYNPKRKHTNNGMLSPVDYETRQHKLNQAGV